MTRLLSRFWNYVLDKNAAAPIPGRPGDGAWPGYGIHRYLSSGAPAEPAPHTMAGSPGHHRCVRSSGLAGAGRGLERRPGRGGCGLYLDSAWTRLIPGAVVGL